MLVLHKLRRYTIQIHKINNKPKNSDVLIGIPSFNNIHYNDYSYKELSKMRHTIMIVNQDLQEYYSRKYHFQYQYINNEHTYIIAFNNADRDIRYSLQVDEYIIMIFIGPDSSYQPVITLKMIDEEYLLNVHVSIFKNLHPQRHNYEEIQEAVTHLCKHVPLIKI